MISRLVILPMAFWISSASALEYAPGVVWDRYADWTPGTTPGSSDGNADDDRNGNPTWLYANLQGGGGLGSATPWFEGTATPQVWDDSWTGALSNQAWARAYNGPGEPKIGANPPITRGNMIHDLSQNTGSWNYKPGILWLNPAGEGSIVNVTGSFTATWNGYGLAYYPDIPIEYVAAKFDSSSNDFEILYSGRVTNPQVGASYTGVVRVTLPDLNLENLRFDEGDYMIYSIRGDSSYQWPAAWVGLTDSLQITLVSQVPEPSRWATMLSGVLITAAVARRRKGRSAS